jgi:hypothetical protein
MLLGRVLIGWLVVALGGATPVWAWRSQLYPTNWQPGVDMGAGKMLPDFSYAGYHRGEQQIPDISGPVYNVINYGARPNDVGDDAGAIQAAIDAAENNGGGVVYLPTGTYYVKPTYHAAWSGDPNGYPWALLVTKSGVVMRGDGPEKTEIFYDSTYSSKGGIIRIDPDPNSDRNYWPPAAFDLKKGDWEEENARGSIVAITNNLFYPTKVIPVADTSGFRVGDQVMVKARNNDALKADLQADRFNDSQIRGLMYQREVMAINSQAKTITVDIPTRFPIKLTYTPVVYKIWAPVEEVGIEDMSFAMQEIVNMTDDSQIWNSQIIFMRNTLNSWIRNVKSYAPPENHQGYGYTSNAPDELKFNIHSYGIVMRDVRNVTVENVHLKNPESHGEGGMGYLFVLYGNDCLIKDSSATNGRHNFDFKGMEGNGNVIYNSTAQFSPNYPSSDNDIFGKTLQSDFHMWFSHANLIDNITLNGDSFLAQFRAFGNQSITSSGNVFWNTNVVRSHIRGGDTALVSDQWGWGYVIGIRGPQKSKLLTVYGSENPGDAHRPDWVEPVALAANPGSGDGQGTTLEPPSLYMDQLQRRLGHEIPTLTPVPVTFKGMLGGWLTNNGVYDLWVDGKINGLDFGSLVGY